MKPRIPTLLGTLLACGLGTAASHAAVMPYTSDSDTAVLYHLDESTGSISNSAYIDDASSNALDLKGTTNTASATKTSPFQGISGPQGLGTAATITDDTDLTFVESNGGISDALNFETFTIEAWVRNPRSGNGTIFYVQDNGQNQRLFFRLNTTTAGSSVQLIFNNADTSTSTTVQSTRTVLAEDQWYHIAATYDDNGTTTANDSTVKLYLTPFSSSDAVLVQTQTSVADVRDLNDSNERLELGSTFGLNPLGGNLDEVRYSNVVRESFNLVPEPGSLALIGLGSLLILARRRGI
jgi:hypothetical protein